MAQAGLIPSTGLRAEALVGYDSSKVRSSEMGDGMTPQTYRYQHKGSGVVAGVGLGWDIPVAPAVSMGLDVELAKAGGKYSASYGPTGQGMNLYGGARITFKALPLVDIYAKAGVASVSVESSGGNESGIGLRAGAGISYNLSRFLFAKLEYRYTKVEPTSSKNAAFDQFTSNQFVTGLGVRF